MVGLVQERSECVHVRAHERKRVGPSEEGLGSVSSVRKFGQLKFNPIPPDSSVRRSACVFRWQARSLHGRRAAPLPPSPIVLPSLSPSLSLSPMIRSFMRQ